MAQHYGPADEPVPGSGYRLVEFLGRGGFGEVWKATAPGGAEAALKIIHLGGREGRKEFRALQLVKRIRHPNLVPIIGFWLKAEDGSVLDDSLTLMEDLPPDETAARGLRATMVADPQSGGTRATELIIAMGLGDKSLYDRLTECRAQGLDGIPQQELLSYMEKAAEAIDFLNRPVHNLGSGPVAIQHCDIKPHNLMIVGGSAQVCDFGLARMMGADRTTTAAATIAYAAPECLIAGNPSASTDQYALAVTYFELKTGRLPYRDETLMAVMEAKRQGTLDFAPLPPAELAVLRRATAQNPADRFPSAMAMVDQLRRAVAGPERKVARRGKRYAYYLPLIALAALAVVVASDHWWRSQLQGTANRTPLPAAATPSASVPAASVEVPSVAGTPAVATPVPSASVPPASPLPASAPPEPVSPSSAPPESADAFLDRGTELLKQGQFAQAAVELEEAAKLNPRDARIFSRLGAAYSAQKNWQKAVDSFAAAVQIDPNDKDYISRGWANRALGKIDEALADFSAAIRLNPQNAVAYLRRGYAYLDKDDAPRAIADFGTAIKLNAAKPEADFPLRSAYILRASSHIQAGHLDEAAADIAKLMQLGTPEDLQDLASRDGLLETLAAAYADQRKFSDAAKWMSKAVELAPDEATRKDYQSTLQRYQSGKP